MPIIPALAVEDLRSSARRKGVPLESDASSAYSLRPVLFDVITPASSRRAAASPRPDPAAWSPPETARARGEPVLAASSMRRGASRSVRGGRARSPMRVPPPPPPPPPPPGRKPPALAAQVPNSASASRSPSARARAGRVGCRRRGKPMITVRPRGVRPASGRRSAAAAGRGRGRGARPASGSGRSLTQDRRERYGCGFPLLPARAKLGRPGPPGPDTTPSESTAARRCPRMLTACRCSREFTPSSTTGTCGSSTRPIAAAHHHGTPAPGTLHGGNYFAHQRVGAAGAGRGVPLHRDLTPDLHQNARRAYNPRPPSPDACGWTLADGVSAQIAVSRSAELMLILSTVTPSGCSTARYRTRIMLRGNRGQRGLFTYPISRPPTSWLRRDLVPVGKTRSSPVDCARIAIKITRPWRGHAQALRRAISDEFRGPRAGRQKISRARQRIDLFGA